MMRYLLGAILVIVAIIGIHWIQIDREIGSRDDIALASHYADQEINVIETVESPSNQTCFQIELRDEHTGRRSPKIALVSSRGHDQDNWEFSGEFGTMQKCVAALNRG
jgi:hypothetical protein